MGFQELGIIFTNLILKCIMGIIADNLKRPEGLIGKLLANLLIKENRVQYDRLIQAMRLRGNEKLIEIGFGHGMGIKKIVEKSPVHITGIDFSQTMLEMATKRNRKYIKQGRVNLHYGDILKFPLEEENYDIIYCLNVIYFWDDLVLPFTKIHNALKHGGRFCFTMAHRDHLIKSKVTNVPLFNKYSIETVEAELKKAGFVTIETDFNIEYLVQAVKG